MTLNFSPLLNQDTIDIIEHKLKLINSNSYINFELLEEQLKNVNSLVLPNIHQSTGHIFIDEEISRIKSLCLKYDVKIIYENYPIFKVDDQKTKYIKSFFEKYIPKANLFVPIKSQYLLVDFRRYNYKFSFLEDKFFMLDLNLNLKYLENKLEKIKLEVLEIFPRVVKNDMEWKVLLTQEQYNICRQKATEKAFSGRYNLCTANGIYHCVCCDNKLFSSDHKIKSKTGWPSYSSTIDKNSIYIQIDRSHNMTRQEVLCAVCDAHLGHLFVDTRSRSGQRYCINSTSLKLK
jgi:peptide-methionine (R)-S-oxide reductase